MTARGRPVSHALEIPHGLLAPALHDVLRAVDAVHGDGDLPRIPLTWAPLTGQESVFRTDPVTGEPLQIVIRTTGKLPRLAALHEIGHFLDHRGIGVAGVFASAHSRLLGPWRSVVRRSRAIQELAAVQRRDALLVAQAAPEPPELVFRRAFLRYLLTYHETWARCYAQFVALRGSNLILLDELSSRRLASPGLPQHWDGDDFAPIAAEIERLFRRLRWLA